MSAMCGMEVPWQFVHEIGVHDADIASQVSTILAPEAHKPRVVIRPEWYYRGGP